MKLKILLFCLFNSSFLLAQGFNSEDRAYFEKQLPQFERWMQVQGLDVLFKIHELETKGDQVNLYLVSKFRDADSTRLIWEKLKNSYEIQSDISLEQHLLERFSNLMEVSKDQALRACLKI